MAVCDKLRLTRSSAEARKEQVSVTQSVNLVASDFLLTGQKRSSRLKQKQDREREQRLESADLPGIKRQKRDEVEDFSVSRSNNRSRKFDATVSVQSREKFTQQNQIRLESLYQADTAGKRSKSRSPPKGAPGKKNVFSKEQRTILKKWLIAHAENPYLTDNSKLELSEKTGLDYRQISNWFTNVRKRIWQPIKRKNKHGIDNLIMKVKLKLESEADSCNMSVDRTHEEMAPTSNFGIDHLQNLISQKQTDQGGSFLQQILSQRPKRRELDLVNKFNKLDGFDIYQGRDKPQEVQPVAEPVQALEHQPKTLNPEIMSATQNQNSFYQMVSNFQQAILQKQQTAKEEAVLLQKKDGEKVQASNPNLSANLSGANVSFMTHNQVSSSGRVKEIHELDNQKSKCSTLNNLSLTAQHPGISIKENTDVQKNTQGHIPVFNFENQQKQYFILKQIKQQLDQKFVELSDRAQEPRVKDTNSDSDLKSNKRTQKLIAKIQELTDQRNFEHKNEARPQSKDPKEKLALKLFVKKSKVLRFRDRMHNVRVWKRNSLTFAEKHIDKVENPIVEDKANYISPELLQELCGQQEIIEKEFKEHENIINHNKQLQDIKPDGDDTRANAFKFQGKGATGNIEDGEERPTKHIEFPQANRDQKDFDYYHMLRMDQKQSAELNQGNLKQFMSHPKINSSFKDQESPNFEDESIPNRDNSNPGKIPVTLPRSKSLSNNQSGSSYLMKLNPELESMQKNGSPFFFVPIILVCCPSIIKGKKCKCGYNSYIAANDFYMNQITNYQELQNRIANNNSSKNGANNNSYFNSRVGGENGGGGSGASGFGESQGLGNLRNGSGSNPSNNQSSGQSWQTTAGNVLNPLNFINILNMLAFEKQQDARRQTGNQTEYAQPLPIDKQAAPDNSSLALGQTVQSQPKVLPANAKQESEPIDYLINLLTELVKSPDLADKEYKIIDALKMYEQAHNISQRPLSQTGMMLNSIQHFQSQAKNGNSDETRQEKNEKSENDQRFDNHLEKASNVIDNLRKVNEINNLHSKCVLLNEIEKTVTERKSKPEQLPSLLANSSSIPHPSLSQMPFQPTGIQSTQAQTAQAPKKEVPQGQQAEQFNSKLNLYQFLYQRLMQNFQMNHYSQNVRQGLEQVLQQGLDNPNFLQLIQNQIIKSASGGGSGSGGSADGVGQSGKISGSRTSGNGQGSGINLSMTITNGQQQSLSNQTGDNGNTQPNNWTLKTMDTSERMSGNPKSKAFMTDQNIYNENQLGLLALSGQVIQQIINSNKMASPSQPEKKPTKEGQRTILSLVNELKSTIVKKGGSGQELNNQNQTILNSGNQQRQNRILSDEQSDAQRFNILKSSLQESGLSNDNLNTFTKLLLNQVKPASNGSQNQSQQLRHHENQSFYNEKRNSRKDSILSFANNSNHKNIGNLKFDLGGKSSKGGHDIHSTPKIPGNVSSRDYQVQNSQMRKSQTSSGSCRQTSHLFQQIQDLQDATSQEQYESRKQSSQEVLVMLNYLKSLNNQEMQSFALRQPAPPLPQQMQQQKQKILGLQEFERKGSISAVSRSVSRQSVLQGNMEAASLMHRLEQIRRNQSSRMGQDSEYENPLVNKYQSRPADTPK